MNKHYILLTYLLIASVFVSCNKSEIPSQDDNTSIEIDKSYILFDVGISTRGALNEAKVLTDNFNVLGYQYPGEWKYANTTLLPNVFGDENGPQLVKYESGIFTYNPMRRWTGNTYSFFAYYPIDNENLILFDNGSTRRGIPYITYNLPNTNDPRDLIDVLTAGYLNTGVSQSTANTVSFEMVHRLSAIDICARNNYKYDHDNNPETDGVAVNIEITNFEITFNNIKTSAKLYLDTITPEITTETGSTGTRSYQIIGNAGWGMNSVVLTPNNNENPNLQYITTATKGKETTLIVIPQEDLDCHIKLTYQKKYTENNTNIETPVTVEKDITFTNKLVEGYRYYLDLTFTSEAVSVRVDSTNSWEDLDDVEHKFE